MTTLAQALQQAIRELHMHDQARLDAEVLLGHVLNKPRSYLHAWPEAELSGEQVAQFRELVKQRAAGRPVAHLTGHREFWSLDLEVTPHSLIPRPETELLVEQALALLPADKLLQVADLGTGSGAVGIALATERPQWRLCAVDRSLQCIELARRNARRLKVPGMTFINADWSGAFAGASLDAIVSNPPYVADRDPHLVRGDVRFEPTEALAAGPHGLDDLKTLIGDAGRVLRPGAWIVLEHALDQAQDVRKLLKNNGFIDIQTIRDLAGLERVSRARKPV